MSSTSLISTFTQKDTTTVPTGWTTCTTQFKVKLNVISQDEHANTADIALYAKNNATLEEYVHREAHFNATYLNKLDKWINKKKYTIT